MMEDGFIKLKVYDERTKKVKKLNPTLTSWGRDGGLPIYERLPSSSQTYQIQNPDDVKVLVEDRPESLQIGIWQNSNSILVIQSGTLTWKYGQVPIESYAVNIESLNLQDGEYQVGYYLSQIEVEQPPEFIRVIENQSLSTTSCIVESSQPNTLNLVRGLGGEPWKTSNTGDDWVVFDFTSSVIPNSFEFYHQIPTETLNFSLYSSPNAVVWELEETGILGGQSTLISIPRTKSNRYWKVYFYGGVLDFYGVLYSGEAVIPNQRLTGTTSVAEPFIDNKFAELEQTGIILGHIEVKNKKLVNTVDTRRYTRYPYQPVSKWLTTFQDESLKKLFSEVVNYQEYHLSPETAARHRYEDLLQDPLMSLGDYKSTPIVTYPSELVLEEPQFLLSSPTLSTSTQEEISTERDLEIEAELVPLEISNYLIKPLQIFNLGFPQEEVDLATVNYVDEQLKIEVDNGTFD